MLRSQSLVSIFSGVTRAEGTSPRSYRTAAAGRRSVAAGPQKAENTHLAIAECVFLLFCVFLLYSAFFKRETENEGGHKGAGAYDAGLAEIAYVKAVGP